MKKTIIKITPIIIGVDPGVNGGIAIKRGERIETFKMPNGDNVKNGIEAMYSFFVGIEGIYRATVFIEQIPKFIDAQALLGYSTAILYGNMMGAWCLLRGLGVEVIPITPQKWQKTIGCQNKEGLEKKEWKNKLKSFAKGVFPKVKVTLWNSDALLIMEAGRRLNLAETMPFGERIHENN